MSFYDSASLAFLPSGGAGKDGKAYSIKPVPEYGNELVTNGGFDTDSYWTKETGWSIANGKATQDGSAVGAGGAGDLVSGGTIFQIGKTYLIKIDIVDYVSGDLDVTSSNIPLSANKDGSYYTYYTAATAYLHIRAGYSAFIGSIDNVSVKEVIVDGDFTFSRGSNLTATRIDSNGLIEKGRENLLENSVWDGVTTDTKPTGWTFQLVSGTGTFDVTATEGQIRFQTLDASSRAFIYSPTITTNGIVVASVYVDEVTTAMPLSDLLSRSANATDLFAYEDGVQINYYSDNVQAGKRYSVVFNKTASTNFRFGVGVSSGTLGDVVLSRPQVEIGLVATEWITSPIGSKGFAGILEHSPRFDYSGGASCPSLLLEPSRTNLVPYSEYFEGSGWLNSGITFDANNIISPQGLQNAYKITTAISHSLFFNTSVSVSTDYTLSFYAKRGTMTNMKYAIYDVTNGNFIIPTTSYYSSTSADEWTRISATFTTPSNCVSARIFPVYNSGSSGDVYLFGAQVEQGSYPTSYIPNHSGGSVTRNADYFKVINQEGLFGTNEGTFFMEFAFDVNNKYIGIGDTWPSDKVTIGLNASGTNQIRSLIINDGVGINLQGSGTTLGETIKACVSYGSNGFKLFMNGSLEDSDSTAARLAQFSDLIPNVDVRDVGGANSGTIKQILVFPEALSNTDCEILTGTSYESFAAMATALNYTTYE